MDIDTKRMPGTRTVGAMKIEQLSRIWVSTEKPGFGWWAILAMPEYVR